MQADAPECNADEIGGMGHTGLEPVTSCVSCKRASQLRQWPYLSGESIAVIDAIANATGLRRKLHSAHQMTRPMRRMCGVYRACLAALRPDGLSYPLSRHRCCWCRCGSGRGTTIASIVAFSSLESCTFAPAMLTPSGPPANRVPSAAAR